MKISILFATCGREALFEKAFGSLDDTTMGKDYDIEVVTVVDQSYINATEAITRFENNVVDYSQKRRGALWAWNRALQISTGDILVPAGDDQLFHPGWLDYALESHHTKLNDYGVVGMNDLAYDGNKQLATMILMDRRWCKERMGGILAPPCYHYYCVDSEINAKAKMFGEFYWESRSIVEHLHSAHNKRPKDELDLEKEIDNWMELDNKTFEDRKAQGFSITWQPII